MKSPSKLIGALIAALAAVFVAAVLSSCGASAGTVTGARPPVARKCGSSKRSCDARSDSGPATSATMAQSSSVQLLFTAVSLV